MACSAGGRSSSSTLATTSATIVTVVTLRAELLEENQMKEWKREQDQIAKMKEYIAR